MIFAFYMTVIQCYEAPSTVHALLLCSIVLSHHAILTPCLVSLGMECAIQVLFEAVLDSAKSGEIEWTICDIDDWLEGNEFWNFPKIKRAK